MRARTWDAIVLAGGQGRRLGGVDKPALVVRGRSLLDTALAACADAQLTIVVGPRRDTARPVRWTQESPPGSGPLAALAAGVAALDDGGNRPVVVLAADLPGVDASVVGRLLDMAGSTTRVDGAFVVDGSGRPQTLLAAYRRGSLEHALRAVGDPRNRPLRSILEHVRLATVDGADAAFDIDTPEDLARWEATMLEEWVRKLCQALDVPVEAVPVDDVLNLARDAAHNVDRPAAPVTAYIVGYAAGRRAGDANTAAEATETAAAMARDWP